MNNKGLSLVEFIICAFLFILISGFLFVMLKYGGKPVSEMPIWFYFLFGR